MSLQPGVVSPMRSVPPHIPRPEYVGQKRAARHTGSEVKDAETIEKMRIAGKLVDGEERIEVRNPYTGAVVGTPAPRRPPPSPGRTPPAPDPPRSSPSP